MKIRGIFSFKTSKLLLKATTCIKTRLPKILTMYVKQLQNTQTRFIANLEKKANLDCAEQQLITRIKI